MSRSYDKARTSAQGAFLTEQVGKRFGQIFLLLSLSFTLLALFIPSSLFFNNDLIVNLAPNICNGSIDKSIKEKILLLEDEIKSLNLKLSLASSSTTSPQVLEQIYNKSNLMERIQKEYRTRLAQSNGSGIIMDGTKGGLTDISPIRPPIL